MDLADYDWWAFPLDERSSRGLEYTVTPEALGQLKANAEFMKNLQRGVRGFHSVSQVAPCQVVLLMLSWGWDVLQNKPIEKPAVC